MAEGGQKPVAAPAAAELGAGRAAAGDDEPVGPVFAVAPVQNEIPAGEGREAYILRHELRAALVQREAQAVQNAGRGVGRGVYPPGRLRDREKAQRAEPFQRPRRVKAAQGDGGEVAAAVVMTGERAAVGEIAAAVARGHELFAETRLPLIDHDAVFVLLQRRERGRHAGRAAADDGDVHCASPFRAAARRGAKSRTVF